ncbi:SGNH/GDSL hydrolase family protein [Xanthomonas theicola]|uniref:Lysophospholipase n=2 Tax=Xanthomonas theicola TaxID=56464 RepID=A0A2S6ZAN2_9XANT|nr:SGNH/GDSL hydrolase family protein [Xanthomonas theicola]PPT79669.1 lysophospholipase [Xanthomonas theicola]QNH27167.1 SGNH/GDSL hydrolase family protein [Xanthomonas theicola]
MKRRYLALGDSYTIGEGVPASGRWPLQLAQALRAEGMALDDPQIVAATGWTTDELDAGIDAAAPRPPFDLVSLLIGVNDQYRGRALGEYRARFSALLARAVGFAGGRGGRVLVLSIPDWGVTPFARAQGRDPVRTGSEIDAFNAVAAKACAALGVAFVDITPCSRAHGHDAGMLAGDALHPSSAMYAGWSALALPAARRALRPR